MSTNTDTNKIANANANANLCADWDAQIHTYVLLLPLWCTGGHRGRCAVHTSIRALLHYFITSYAYMHTVRMRLAVPLPPSTFRSNFHPVISGTVDCGRGFWTLDSEL